MMSAAKSRASALSVGKNSTMQSQSFSSCQNGLEIVFVLRSQDRPDHLLSKFCFRTRNTQTIHSLSVPSYSLLLFTGHYGATGAL